jgi:DNA uptake protein ComE-like DNA-binding protein
MLAEGSMRKRRSWILGGATGGLIPIAAISLVIASASLISCTNRPQPESDQQLKQQAANATQTVKQQSKDALANARVAAANAERKVNDIADGVKQGMDNHSSAPAGSAIDINTASTGELESLPGISHGKAGQIVEHRPYRASHDLVNRGLLTPSQYAAISGRVTAQ